MDASLGTLSGVFAQRYSIEGTLGRGATAAVYLARDTTSGLPVAIKVLRRELAETMGGDRFLREIKLTEGLHHPRILRVLDSGEFEGRLYFVLPFMDGGTLRSHLTREHQLPLEEAVQIACTVADALAHAHQQGYVHRDVKPENILFSNGEVCLADFGIARAIERSIEDTTTSTGIARGTPAYMSPEQASGAHDYDGRSDVYSLGCVLYEMIAGMPPFIGPTPQAVIAQRFLHPPRELNVYRANVPAKLHDAVRRAMQTTPADRFKSAGEFSDALRSITASDYREGDPKADWVRALFGTPARRVATAATAVLAATAIAMTSTRGLARHDETVAADTTHLVLLPLEGQTSRDVHWRDDDLMHQALARWRGLHVVDEFQVADGIRRAGADLSANGAASLATSLGAKRYIRGQLSPLGSSRRAYFALYDVTNNRALYTVAGEIPKDLVGATIAYAHLADSLLLRGATVDSSPGNQLGTRSLPALQGFAHAQAALDEWHLDEADSAFQSAVYYDGSYARAALWLAQVRAWRAMPRSTWGSLAEGAVKLGAQLNERERLLGSALVLLYSGEYKRACDEYSRLRARNDRDFAAWFGLGQCRTMDRIVVADSQSPSKWRFRSSVAPAMAAFSTAFGILPSVHQGYERAGFETLQRLLLLSTDLRVGYRAADSAIYYGRLGWLADTLVMVPYPVETVARGDSSSIPPGFARALVQRRNEFRRLAAAWSSAFPRSAVAKHAVAVSLDLVGDPTSIDTMRLARRMETDPSRQLMFASAEVILLTKFGTPDDLSRLRAARALSDSLLARESVLTVSDAESLAPVAALSGRCRQSDVFAHAMVPAAGYEGIPASLLGDGNTLVARISMGCPLLGTTVASVSSAVDRAYGKKASERRSAAEQHLLYRPVELAPYADRSVTDRLGRTSGDPLLAAAASIVRGDKSSARIGLLAVDSTVSPSGPTPDISLARARLWVAIGDTARAIQVLDGAMEGVRLTDSKDLADPANAGSLVSAMLLRAELASRVGDNGTAQRWARAVAILIASADKELANSAEKNAQIAKTR